MSLTDEEKRAMLELHDGGTRIRPQSSMFDENKFVVAVLWDCFATYLPTNKLEVTQVIESVVGDWVKINDINTNEREFEVANDLDTYSKKLGEEIDMIATAIQHIRTLEDNGHVPICEARTSGCPTTVIDFLRDKPVPDRTAALKRYFLWRQVPLQENRVDHLLPLMKRLEYRRALVDEAKHHLSLLRPASTKQGAPSAKFLKQSPHAANADHSTSVGTHSLTTLCLSSITAESGDPAKSPPQPLAIDTERHQTPQASAVTKCGNKPSDPSMPPTPKERPKSTPKPKPPKTRKPILPTGSIETDYQSSTVRSDDAPNAKLSSTTSSLIPRKKQTFEAIITAVPSLEDLQAHHCQRTKTIFRPTTTNTGTTKLVQSHPARQHFMNGKIVSAEEYYGFDTVFEMLALPQKQTLAHVQGRPESMEQLLYGDMEQPSDQME